MTEQKFIDIVYRLRDLVDVFNKIDKLCCSEWTMGPVNNLFNIIEEVMLPEAPEYVLERFGDLLFAGEVSSSDISNVYEMYIESLF